MTTLPDVLIPMMATFSGAMLGAIFFGGLWWTVRHAATFRRPGLAVFIGLVFRLGVTLCGFYLTAQGQWQRMLWCLLGFVIARAAVTRLTRLQPRPARAATGARHAP